VVQPDREMATVQGVRNGDGTITVQRVLRNVRIKSTKGTLRPEIANLRSAGRGKRRMSPWQARALGSGMGVVAPADMVFTMDPQYGMGNGSHGHSTRIEAY
jgi:hypothetical protein